MAASEGWSLLTRDESYGGRPPVFNVTWPDQLAVVWLTVSTNDPFFRFVDHVDMQAKLIV